MSDNQREVERKARRLAKNRKKQKIIWIILAVIIIVIAIMKISEIDFVSLKDKFTDDNGKFSISEVFSKDEKFPISLDASDDIIFTSVGKNLAVLNDVSYTVIDSSKATVKYRDIHGYSNPIMKTNGDYTVIYDQGSHRYRLDNSSKNIYEDKINNTILCADTSASGVVALATTSDSSKSEILVYNKSLKEKKKYNVTYGYVTSIAIDDSANRIAFAVVNSENAKLNTIVYTMSMNDEKPRASFSYESSTILDLHFSSSNLYVVGSDFVSVISSLKKENKVFNKGAINTVSYCYNQSDELVIAFSEYTGSNTDKIAYVTPSAKVKSQIDTKTMIKDITASKSKISILTSDHVITYNTSKGEEINKFDVDDSYTSIMQMSSDVFAKHQSLVEHLN